MDDISFIIMQYKALSDYPHFPDGIGHLIPIPFGPHGQATACEAWTIINTEFNSPSYAHISMIVRGRIFGGNFRL